MAKADQPDADGSKRGIIPEETRAGTRDRPEPTPDAATARRRFRARRVPDLSGEDWTLAILNLVAASLGVLGFLLSCLAALLSGGGPDPRSAFPDAVRRYHERTDAFLAMTAAGGALIFGYVGLFRAVRKKERLTVLTLFLTGYESVLLLLVLVLLARMDAHTRMIWPHLVPGIALAGCYCSAAWGVLLYRRMTRHHQPLN